MDLRTKLLLAFLVVNVVPLLLGTAIMISMFRSSTMEDALKSSEGNIARVSKVTQEMIKAASDISNRIALDEEVSRMALRKYSDNLDAVTALRGYERLNDYEFFMNEIARIKLYVPNSTLINNWQFIPLDAMVLISWWYRVAANHPGLIGWLYFEDPTRPVGAELSLVRYIKLTDSNTHALLVIDLDTKYLNSLLAREPFETIVLDGNGVVVASNITARVGRPLTASLDIKDFSFKAGETWDHEINGKPCRIFVQEIKPPVSFNSLKIVSIMSMESIMGKADRISYIGLVLTLFSFGGAFGAIFFMSGLMSRRLSSLASQVQQVGGGNFSVPALDNGLDEIGVLSRQFDLMVHDIQRLMDEVALGQQQRFDLEKKNLEIRLSMLTSQINPHFMYNALESIRMKAVIAGEKDLGRVVMLLGRLLRKKLELGSDCVHLSEEIQMVDDYLEIQKFRHGPGLRYSCSVDQACKDAYVPAFCLQPLVENAVHHGLERKMGGGSIVISASLKEEMVVIQVRDDGLGMSPEMLAEVRESLKTGGRRSIGLRNVHERLELMYGPDSGLKIESTPQSGTCISFAVKLEEHLCTK